MIIWTPTVLSVLYACVLYFCICTCSAQLSMFHMERRSRNTLIITTIIKSPGPNKITNEMLEQHFGTKSKLLGKFNSWKAGHVSQSWPEADMVPIHKKGKNQANTDSYRPITLTSCVGKLMERLINTRQVRHLEKNIVITPVQADILLKTR